MLAVRRLAPDLSLAPAQEFRSMQVGIGGHNPHGASHNPISKIRKPLLHACLYIKKLKSTFDGMMRYYNHPQPHNTCSKCCTKKSPSQDGWVEPCKTVGAQDLSYANLWLDGRTGSRPTAPSQPYRSDHPHSSGPEGLKTRLFKLTPGFNTLTRLPVNRFTGQPSSEHFRLE
jgi:hypothetical protein